MRKNNLTNIFRPFAQVILIAPLYYLTTQLDFFTASVNIAQEHRANLMEFSHGAPRMDDLIRRTLEADANGWLAWISLLGGALFVAFIILLVVYHRQKREAIRTHSEIEFRALSDSAPTGIVQMDLSEKVLYANASAARMFGLSPQELIHNGMAQYASDPSKLAAMRREFQSSGQIRDYEMDIQNARGEKRHLLFSASLQQGVASVSLVDMTDRVLAEKELRRFSRVVSQMADTVVVTDIDGTIEYVNPAFEELTGYSSTEALGKTPRILKSDHHDIEFYKRLWNTILNGEVFQSEIVNRKKNGELYYETKTITPIRDTEGKITHFVATGKDVTERKQIEESLHQKEAEYHLIADNTGDVIWILDLESQRFTYVSPSVKKLRGLTPVEVLAQPMSVSMTPESMQKVAELLPARLEKFTRDHTQSTYTDQLDQYRKDGSIVQTEVTTNFVSNEQDKIQVVGISRDITERAQAQILQDVLYNIAEAAQNIQSLQNFYPKIHEQIGRVMYAENFYIALYEEAADMMNFVYSVDKVDPVNEGRYPMGKGLTSYVIHKGKSLLYQLGNKPLNLEIIGIPTAVWLGVPLKVAGKTIGAMAVQHYFDPNAYNEREQRMLEFVSAQVAIVIERKQAEELQRKQKSNLEYHYQLVKIMNSISTRFINLPIDQIDTEINHAIQQLGEFEKMDRSYIFLFDNERINMNNTYEWCAPGVEPQIENLQNIPSASFPWWMEKLKRGEEVNIPLVSQLPPEAQAEREILEPQGIQSLLVVPLISNNGLVGFIGFETIVRSCTWDTDSILLTKMMGDIISNALTRKTTEEAIRMIEKRNRALIENASDGIVLLDHEGRFIFGSPSAARMLGYEMENLLGTSSANIIHPDDHPILHSIHKMHIEAPSKIVTVNYRVLHKNGSYRWLEATYTNLFQEPGVNALVVNFRDITEQKLAAEMLLKSQTNLENAQAIAHLGSWELDTQSSAGLFWSKEMYRLFHRDPVLGAPKLEEFMQLVNPDDHESLLSAEQRAIETGEVVSTEYSACLTSNEIRYFRASIQAAKNEEGQFLNISGTVLDVTESHRMEYQIRERVKELTCLFNVSRLLENPQIAKDTVCNKIIEYIIPAMQFPQLTVPVLLLDDIRYTTSGFDEGLTHSLSADIEVNGNLHGRVSVFYTADQPFIIPEEQDLLSNIARMLNLWLEEREAEIAVRTAQRELEELNRDLEKRVEERTAEVRRSEATYRALFENSNDGIFLIAPNGEDLRANQQALNMLGYTLEEYKALPRNGAIAIEQTADADERFSAALRGEYVPLYERVFINKDGKKVDVEINLSPVRDPSGKVIMVQSVVRDITERKKAEEALRENRDKLSIANSSLEKASHLKDEFLASMSHELRTPLTGILGLSEVLQMESFGSLSQKQAKALKNIETSGRHLLELINDILDLSKIEAGKLDMQFGPCSISDICQASLQLVKGMAHQKKQNINFNINPISINVRADSRRLKQMLVNLLSNAVKFTPEGGELGLEVRTHEDLKAVSLSVWDKGIGIRSEEMGKLFKPFVQLDSSLARQYYGTGLGLSLVQRMAELHGGSIKVESIPDEGSRFTIMLPWSADATQPVGSLKQLDTASLKTILVIEDNELDAEHAMRYLTEFGIAYIHQPVMQGALEQAALLHPSTILLDLNLSDGSGLNLLNQIKADERTREIPVIITSVEERRTEAAKLGAIGYLVKPFTQQELRNELSKAAATIVRPADQSMASTVSAYAPLVMIADDNEIVLEMVTDYLEAKGCRVITVRSGFELLERAPQVHPDIMLVDIQMPGMDGIEAMRGLRAHHDPQIASTPIIAVTALAMSGDREKCLQAGANDYISKPIALAKLAERIKEFLKEKNSK